MKWILLGVFALLNLPAIAAPAKLEIASGVYEGVERTSFTYNLLMVSENGEAAFISSSLSSGFLQMKRQTTKPAPLKCDALKCTVTFADAQLILAPDPGNGLRVLELHHDASEQHLLTDSYHLQPVQELPAADRFTARHAELLRSTQAHDAAETPTLYLGIVGHAATSSIVALLEYPDGRVDVENYSFGKLVAIPHEQQPMPDTSNGIILKGAQGMMNLHLYQQGPLWVGHEAATLTSGLVMDIKPARFVRVQLSK